MSSPSGEVAASAFRVLMRHFLGGLCRPRVLDDTGQDGLQRVFLGALAGVIAVGLLLARVFAAKYAAMASLRGTEAHTWVLAADTTFLLSVPMLVVALLANLQASALFPDDLDYRICMVLPVKRAVVFRAKLAALAVFVGAAVVAVHVALIPLLLLMWSGEGIGYAILARLPAFVAAGVLASLMALTAVMTVHGLMHALLPAARRDSATAPLRSAIVVILILLVPLAIRASSMAPALAERAGWAAMVPPLWFVGVEQVLLGRADAYLTQLAWLGGVALTCGLGLTMALYMRTYRHFDSPVASATAGTPAPAGRRWWRLPRRASGATCGGVYPFTSATLWRSPLHQGVFTSIAACGVGLVVQRGLGDLNAILAMPFALILLACPALKSALSLPHQWRANWIFRQAERESRRPQQLRSVSRLFWRVGIALPIAVATPVQLWLGGPRTLASVPIALAFGWLLMECLLRQWRRIPFTCIYVPGQRMMAGQVFIVLNSYLLFTVGGVALSRAALTHPRVVAVVLVLVLLTAAALRAARVSLWRTTPLEFDAVQDDQPQRLGIAFSLPQR